MWRLCYGAVVTNSASQKPKAKSQRIGPQTSHGRGRGLLRASQLTPFPVCKVSTYERERGVKGGGRGWNKERDWRQRERKRKGGGGAIERVIEASVIECARQGIEEKQRMGVSGGWGLGLTVEGSDDTSPRPLSSKETERFKSAAKTRGASRGMFREINWHNCEINWPNSWAKEWGAEGREGRGRSKGRWRGALPGVHRGVRKGRRKGEEAA
jgi:hypothetical protein